MRSWLALRIMCCTFCLLVATIAQSAATKITYDTKGVASTLLETVQNSVAIQKLFDSGTQPSAQEIVSSAQSDYRTILGLLYRSGYFDAQVSIKLDETEAAQISPFATPKTIHSIIISVIAGKIFSFDHLTAEPRLKGTVIPADFQTGKIALISVIEETAKDVAAAWRKKGHEKATLRAQTIQVDHATKQVDVALLFDPGPRLSYGQLIARGADRVRPERVQAIAGLPRGKTIDPEQTALVLKRLRDSGAFSVIDLEAAAQANPDDSLDYYLVLKNAPKRRRGFGLEYVTDHGLIFSTYYMHRNLFGGAERLRLGFEIRGIGREERARDYSLDFSFGRPATFRSDTDFFANASLKTLKEPKFNSERFEFHSGLKYRQNKDITFSAGIGYRRSNIDDNFGKRSFELITFPFTRLMDSRDNALDATKGRYVVTSFTPFIGLDDTPSGNRFDIDFRGYHTLRFDRRITLAARTKLGWVTGLAPKDAPNDYLFFSGGGGSVRGQLYQSLAVTLDSGRVTGGAAFAGFSGELRAHLWQKLGLVTFADFGFLGEQDFQTGRSHAGAGFGIRYETGVGPIRLDIGTPLNDNNAFRRAEIYLGIGQSF